MAAATVATDGRRIYAMFANGDLAAFTFDGKIAWSKNLAVPKNPYGHATSLLTWQDRVIVQFDQGQPDDQLSKLYAFAGATGEIVWQQPRPAGASWATPIVFEARASPSSSHCPRRGSFPTQSTTARSLARRLSRRRSHALADLRRQYPLRHQPVNKLQLIQPDGHGDVTKTNLGWVAEDNIPDVTSP